MKNSCNGCGICCRLFYINLSKEEYLSGKYKTMFGDIEQIDDFEQATECGANLLAKKEDDCCVYLDGNLCDIHKDRPSVCRDFFCTTTEERFQNMVEIIKENDTDKKSSIYE